MLLCLITLICAARAAERPRITPVVPYGYGVNIHETQFSPAEAKLISGAGFGLIRMDFYWQSIESKPGVYDFSAYDAQIAQLRTLNVRPLWILDYTNTLYDDNQPPRSPAALQAFAAFARAAAARYEGQGVVWEVWNEPNIKGFWATGPSADEYAALVKAVVPAIHAADDRATILAGATSLIDLPFISELIKQHTLQGVMALSVHPYRQTEPEAVIPEYAALRALLASALPRGARVPVIVCSEWGYSTAWSAIGSDDRQARYAARAYFCNLMSGVDLTIDYDWKDDGPDPSNSEHRFGMVRQDLSPKPAYTLIASLLNQLRGFRYQRRLAAAQDTTYKLLFHGPRGLALVTWSSDPATPPERQTPTAILVGKSDPQYRALLRAPAALPASASR